MQGSRLNTAPLELKRIKLESGIRKYQLTIPLPKSIKKWSIPLSYRSSLSTGRAGLLRVAEYLTRVATNSYQATKYQADQDLAGIW